MTSTNSLTSNDPFARSPSPVQRAGLRSTLSPECGVCSGARRSQGRGFASPRRGRPNGPVLECDDRQSFNLARCLRRDDADLPMRPTITEHYQQQEIGFRSQLYCATKLPMKPALNTPTFRILLSASVVWALGIGTLNYGKYTAITPASERLIGDENAQRCNDPPLIGTKTDTDIMSCMSAAQALLEKDVNRERADSAISGLARTFIPPILVLILNAYWSAVAKAAVTLAEGGRLLSRAYLRWVRGADENSR
jgi:hypothetical protein